MIHFRSALLAFEVFFTLISSHSIFSNLTFGSACYITTGRGFTTYTTLVMLLNVLVVTLTLWTGWVIYFWVSILSLCIVPFLSNAHLFSAVDFIVDYR